MKSEDVSCHGRFLWLMLTMYDQSIDTVLKTEFI